MNEPEDRCCRWGVLGTATIARKFWRSVDLAENARLVAVASRSLERAEEFIREAQQRFPVTDAVRACGSYEALLADSEIDAVYIPLPTGLRKEWVLAAARAGKHVLCEKPCAISLADLQAMTAACETAGVQFMDNVMMMHSRRMHELRRLLADVAEFGLLRRIATQFSFAAPEAFFHSDIRADSNREPWGCLGDLGWYNLRMALWAFQSLPLEVVARFGTGSVATGSGKVNADSAAFPVPPRELSGELFFGDGRSAAFYCSFVTENQQWIHFSGTRGSLWVDDFALGWSGPQLHIRHDRPTFNQTGWDFAYQSQKSVTTIDEWSHGHPDAQEVQLVRTFSGNVLSGKVDPWWSLIALQTQQMMEAVMKSANSGGLPVPLESPQLRN